MENNNDNYRLMENNLDDSKKKQKRYYGGKKKEVPSANAGEIKKPNTADQQEKGTNLGNPVKKKAANYSGSNTQTAATGSLKQNISETTQIPAKQHGKTTLPAKKRENKTFELDPLEKKLQIIPLGGLGEVGKNMTLIKYEDHIIVIDGGVIFPEDELLGVDMVIPDYSYLLANKDKLRAFILTHGHEDHIGAMPYILQNLTAPVYGSRFTLGLLKGKLIEHHVSADLKEVSPRQKVTIGPFEVEFIRVAHSIPDCMAVAVHTPIGTVLMVSDFKMDMSPIDGQLTDFGRLSRLGEAGVLLLLADSTNAEKEGFTPSERTVGEAFDRIFFAAKGRIILTSFASNVHRIQQAVWSAQRAGRKVAIVGRGMQNVSSIAMELGYLKIPSDLLVDIEQVNYLPANKILILTTGSQGEPLSGLTRMSMGEHRQVHIIPGDLVIVSATPIPGNERLVGKTIDNLFRQGAMVIHEKGEKIHVSGHASREELKVLLNMIKPKFFIPVHGEYRMLYKHALLAQQIGMDEKNIFILENGQVLDVSRRGCKINGTVPSGRVFIDGLGVGDVGNAVLKDRKLLSEGGVVIVTLVIDEKSKQVVGGPEIFSRGFIFERDYEHIISEAKNKVDSLCTKEKLETTDIESLKNQIRNTTSRFLFDYIGRRPIVVPIITKI